MKNKTCHFCNITNRWPEWVFANKYFNVIYDIYPVSPGHTVIIPKRHEPSLLALKQDEWIWLHKIIIKSIQTIESTNFKIFYKKIIAAQMTPNSVWFCKKMLKHKSINKKPAGYNIGCNEGRTAGRTIDHLHWQIVPRFKGDVEDPTGGIRNIIPGLGNYKLKR